MARRILRKARRCKTCGGNRLYITNQLFGSSGGGGSPEVPTASSLSLTPSAGVYTLAYTYAGGVEQNKPPTIEDVTITGTESENEVLTATVSSSVHSPYSISSTSYQWVRYNAQRGGARTAISGATSLTYTPVSADVGFFVGVEVTVTQSGGANPTSDVYRSRLTGAISAASTLPLSYSPAVTVRVSDAAADYATTGIVANLGSLGGNTVPNSTSFIPAKTASYFHIDALGNDEIFKIPASNYTRPVTVWMKFQLNSLPAGNSGLICFSGVNRIAAIGTGSKYQVKDSTNANCADNSAGTDLVVCKFTLNGNSSRVIENNSFDSGVLSAGTGGALNGSYHTIGANHTMTGEKADMNLYECYVYTSWNDVNDTDMWAYFGY